MTATVDPSVVMRELARREMERRKNAVASLDSTVEFARFTGTNTYDPVQGIYPWMPFAEEQADYLDREVLDMGLPIKPVARSRGHLKTEVACHALARYILKNPEKRCCIVGANAERAQKNLIKINEMLMGDKCQGSFPTILYKPDSDAFTKTKLLVKRSGSYREDSIETFGRTSRMAGRHYNGIVWLDDLITEQDDFENNIEIAEQIKRLMNHIIDFVVDPGAEIWVTFTRYHVADPYAELTDPEGCFRSSVVKPEVIGDCFEELDDGTKEALFPFRHCIKKEDEVADVSYRGTVYPNVRRKSLEEMENRMPPKEWYSQMLNRPMVGEIAGFDEGQFQSVLDVDGPNFLGWLDTVPEHRLDEMGVGHEAKKGLPRVTILGDPSYGKSRTNDFAVLMAVAQTPNNHWVVLDGFRERIGYERMDDYLRLAIRWKEQYGARELGIEKHAREILENLAIRIAAEEGKRISFHPLPANSQVKKKDRISQLIPIFAEHRIHWCKNVDRLRKDIMKEALTFPHCCDNAPGLHDDGLDALANGCQVFSPRRTGPKRKKTLRYGRGHNALMAKLRRYRGG